MIKDTNGQQPGNGAEEVNNKKATRYRRTYPKSGTVQKHDSRSKVRRVTMGSLITVLLLLLYIPSLLNWLNGATVKTDIIRNGIMENSINVDAILIRNEEMIKPPVLDGRVIAMVGEGQKAAAFMQVATVLNTDSEKLLNDLDSINGKIVKARMEQAEKANFYSADLLELDQGIGEKVQLLIEACNGNSFEDISSVRTQIDKIVEKKSEIIGENTTDAYVDSMLKQKSAIERKLNSNTVQVMTKTSGIISYVIDGYEETLKPSKLTEITPVQIDQIIQDYAKRKEGDGRAHAGKALAKVIKGSDLYIAAAIDHAKANNIKTDDRVKLRFNEIGLEADGTVATIGDPADGRCLIGIRTNRGLDELSSNRIADVDIIFLTEEGLKVPVSCLKNFTSSDQAQIMVIKANVAAIRTVDILCKDQEYAIIRTPENEWKKTVNLYDTYVLNPDRVKEGEIINK